MSGVTINISGGICEIKLSRPEQRNAINTGLLDALNDTLDSVQTDTAVRCVVLTGEGRAFCAGADLAEWAQAESEGRLETYGWTERAHALMVKLAALPKPTIAAINGAAVGAGMDMALCCDFRYAVSTAKFFPGYTSMAYTPDAGGSWLLPRLIGMEAAKQFLFFDKPWSAEKAQQAGLVTEVFDAENFMASVSEVAKALAAGPTFAYGKTKELLEQSTRLSLFEQLKLEQQVGLACGRTEDAQEALQASIEKRQPNFVGR